MTRIQLTCRPLQRWTMFCALLAIASPAGARQAPEMLLVTVLDDTGAPVTGLTRDRFTVRRDGVELEVLSVESASSTVHVIAIFEGLAVTQRQLTSTLSRFIGSLDDESIVDMQSVEGELDTAIVEAVSDLHARSTSRPVVLLLGQPSEIAPSSLQSSQVRGRRRAADLTGNIDQVAALLREHSILFYGISVTNTPLNNLERLAAETGGHFHAVEASDALEETVAQVGHALGEQYLISLSSSSSIEAMPQVSVGDSSLTVRAGRYTSEH